MTNISDLDGKTCKLIPVDELRIGHLTVVVTVKTHSGKIFSDRRSARAKIAVWEPEMSDTATISRYADEIMKAIDEDIANGCVPAGIASFSALHDHVDANMYVIDAMHDDFPEPDSDECLFSDEETDAANAAMDEVDRRLAARAEG